MASMVTPASERGQREESTKARFHASLGQRKIPLGGTWRGKMPKTYTKCFSLPIHQFIDLPIHWPCFI